MTPQSSSQCVPKTTYFRFNVCYTETGPVVCVLCYSDVLCLSLQHPQIQKESQYIKYLCCDDAWTMNLWVTGIRIAKVNWTLSSPFSNRKRPPVEQNSCSVLWCVSSTHSTVHRCMKTIKQPRRRLLSARRGRTAALHQAPIHQRPRPPSKVSTAHESCL